MNNQQETQNDFKQTNTKYNSSSGENNHQGNSFVKTGKTYPNEFQLSKNNKMNNIFVNEPTPIESNPEQCDNNNSSFFDFIAEYSNKENELEDELQTEEWFIKITIDEIVSFLFSVLSIGNGIMYYEVRTCGEACLINDPELHDDIIFLTLLMSSVSLLFYLLTMIVKYYHLFKLYHCAKYIQHDEGFFGSDLWKSALVDFIFAIIHPNLLLRDIYCKTGVEWNLIEVEYNVNDFLIVISLFRMFSWIKVAVMQTSFYCARADRVCKMMGMNLSSLFSIKCLLIHNTMEMQFFITAIVITALGYMLKIIEGAVFDRKSEYPHSNNFTDLGSCIWYIFVTMTTVGYGDYSTATLLGRIVTVLVGLIGTILVAFNINFFQSQTQLDEGEQRALELIQRLEAKENMAKVAAQFFRSNVKYFVTKNQCKRGENAKDNHRKKELLRYAKDKDKTRKEFASVLHQFQIEYKANSDVDGIKKKIAELEKYFEKSDEKIDKIEKALESLIMN